MLLLIQTLHTLIAVWNIGCLLFMNVCHALDRSPPLLKLAYLSIAIEGLAIIPFGFVCPIRLLVDHWYSPQADDILIPRPVAVWIMPVGMALLATAVLILPLRFWWFWRTEKARVRALR
jgi:hypothetical protein